MYCFACNVYVEGQSGICQACGKPLDTDCDRYFKAGMEAMAAGDIDRSIRLLKDCLTLKPGHLSGLYNLGIALCMAGEYDEANEQFAMVAEQDPGFPGLFTAMGQAAFGLYLYHSEQAEFSCKSMIKFFARPSSKTPVMWMPTSPWGTPTWLRADQVRLSSGSSRPSNCMPIHRRYTSPYRRHTRPWRTIRKQ